MISSFSFTPRATALGLALFATAFAAVASAALAKSGPASTTFKASGPAGLSIEGTTADASIADDGTTVTITIPLTNLTTGISIRDKHTKEYLEVDKYPNATLRVPRASLKIPASGGESSGDASGSMTIHGQAKNVTFHYSAKRDGAVIGVKGSTRVNMNDFGIKSPSYLGVTVKPDVDITTTFGATE